MSHDDITPEAESEIFEAMVRAEELAIQKKASRIAGPLLHLRLLWIWGLSKNAELTLEEDHEAASRLLGLSDEGSDRSLGLGADRLLHVKRAHLEGDVESLMVAKEAMIRRLQARVGQLLEDRDYQCEMALKWRRQAEEVVASLAARLAALEGASGAASEADRQR